MLVLVYALFERFSVMNGRKVERRTVSVLVKVRDERVERLNNVVCFLTARFIVEILFPLSRLREMVVVE